MSRYTEIVVLCEDRQQEVFARHFLVNCGINRRRIRVKHSPTGRGSAEQHVRQRYPVEVREYRRRRNQLDIGLVVVIDADTRSVTDRLGELETELVKVSPPGRQPDERIGIFVPKRNIETWIHYLQGQSVNERDEYPRLDRAGDCKSSVADLARDRHTPLPENAPPSLQIACDELSRIM